MKLTLHITLIIFQLIIGYNLVLPIILYVFSLLIKKRVKILNFKIKINRNADYAIIVTAYKQITNIPNVIESVLALNYENFIVYVVADHCDISTLNFSNKRVIILKPETTLESNVKSHFYAIDHFVRKHERITIIDSDNLVHAEYLNELNQYFDKGYAAVQGTRKPKNLDTNIACLDAARDIYYHFYDGEVIFNLGSSSTLAGSGMAFETRLYKSCLVKYLNMTGAGFDKVLQAELVSNNFQIAFAGKAIVYDEKTTQKDQLIQQRSRWIGTWFKYFKNGLALIEKGISKSNSNQFIFGIVLVRPPLFVFLAVSFICMFADIFFRPYVSVVWLVGFILFFLSFFIALKKANAHPNIYASLIKIPQFIFYQIIALLRSGKKGTYSVFTEHTYNTGIKERLI